jgi:hypothetical protein
MEGRVQNLKRVAIYWGLVMYLVRYLVAEANLSASDSRYKVQKAREPMG